MIDGYSPDQVEFRKRKINLSVFHRMRTYKPAKIAEEDFETVLESLFQKFAPRVEEKEIKESWDK